MKFSQSLKFNSVPEWQDQYLNYSNLKKLIYQLRQQQYESQSPVTTNKSKFKKFKTKFIHKEGSSDASIDIELQKIHNYPTEKDLDDIEDDIDSISIENFDPAKIFIESLETELYKVNDFYILKEQDFYDIHDTLLMDLKQSKYNNHTNDIEQQLSHDEDDDDDEDDDFNINTLLLSSKDVSLTTQQLITFKDDIKSIYVSLNELKSFIELNKLAFTKITKKFDKELQTKIKLNLIDSELFFKDSQIFQPHTLQRLDEKIEDTVGVYASLTGKPIESCHFELRSYLREFLVLQRSSLWKSQENEFGQVGDIDDGLDLTMLKRLQMEWFSWQFPKLIHMGKLGTWDKIMIPKCLFTRRTFKLAIIIAVTILLLAVKTFNDKQEHRCMAMLACVALLWASELIPLFLTLMLVPLLTVTFQVLKDDDGLEMSGSDLSKYILGKMWSSTVMLLIGGFTLLALLSKYNIAKVLLSFILSVAGTNPRVIILLIMTVATFLSMWISNVAAPVLCFSLMKGLIDSQPSDSQFVQLLLLGVAFASNVGGLSSPIASPQNMIAMQYMTPSPGWGKWFGCAIPVLVLSDLLIWTLVVFSFDVKSAKIKLYKPITRRFTFKQIYISIVSIGTILLWCLMTKLDLDLGEAGQVSVIPFILFFGTGILTVQDLNGFPWGIVVLAMGGIAFGNLISSSGLLNTIATLLQNKIKDYPIYAVMMIFGILILVVATFVSHTVAVLIIIPLVKEVGDNLLTPHPTLLVFTCTMIASAAMTLPTSGFPNVTLISMMDEQGRPYLTVNKFITRGIPASLLVFIVIISVGYGIMSSLGF